MVIEQAWAEPELFAAIFERYLSQIHQYLARRGTHRRQERRLYRALARTDNRWVTYSGERPALSW